MQTHPYNQFKQRQEPHGPVKHIEPPDWKEATQTTIRRVRHLLALIPPANRVDMLHDAHQMTAGMVSPQDGSRYWAVYVNTLRILIASIWPEITFEELFD